MFLDLISLIFPNTCVACDQSLVSSEQFLCTRCKVSIPYTDDFWNRDNNLLQKFVFQPKILSAVALMYFFEGGIGQKILYEIKYNRKRELAKVMGCWMAESASWTIDGIVPVPLHPSKQRIRTFNQSESIAQGISERISKPVFSNWIRREINTASQTKKGKAARWQNIENIYSCCTADLSGLSLLIVDDVITTGATVGMLAQRLIESGAKELHIAAIARR